MTCFGNPIFTEICMILISKILSKIIILFELKYYLKIFPSERHFNWLLLALILFFFLTSVMVFVSADDGGNHQFLSVALVFINLSGVGKAGRWTTQTCSPPRLCPAILLLAIQRASQTTIATHCSGNNNWIRWKHYWCIWRTVATARRRWRWQRRERWSWRVPDSMILDRKAWTGKGRDRLSEREPIAAALLSETRQTHK